MAYLAKEPNSWAAASWTVGLSSALLLGTTNYAALYYLLASNLFLIHNARPVSRSEVDPAAPFSLEKELGSFRRSTLLHNQKKSPPLVVET